MSNLYYALPTQLSLPLLLMGYVAAIAFIFLLLFLMWEDSKIAVLPKIALWLSLIAIAGLPFAIWGTFVVNQQSFTQKIIENYQVNKADISLLLDEVTITQKNKQMSCRIDTQSQQEAYRILCKNDGKETPLNEL